MRSLTTAKEFKFEWDGKTYRDKRYLGNVEDIMMVLDVLKFISSNPEKKNIYKYFKDKIRESCADAYKELDEFRSVGDKIASFIIRDIGLLNRDTGIIKEPDYKFAFPIDTRVNKMGKKEHGADKSNEDIKIEYIQTCKKYNLNPMKFAAGLWYLSFNSEKIIDEILLKIDIREMNIESNGEKP